MHFQEMVFQIQAEAEAEEMVKDHQQQHLVGEAE
jgi:hypothetical protein